MLLIYILRSGRSLWNPTTLEYQLWLLCHHPLRVGTCFFFGYLDPEFDWRLFYGTSSTLGVILQLWRWHIWSNL